MTKKSINQSIQTHLYQLIMLSKDVFNLVKSYQTSLGAFTTLKDSIIWYNGKKIVFWCLKILSDFSFTSLQFLWHHGYLYCSHFNILQKYNCCLKSWKYLWNLCSVDPALNIFCRQCFIWDKKQIQVSGFSVGVYTQNSNKSYNLRKDVRNTFIIRNENGQIFTFSYKANQVFDLTTETFQPLGNFPLEFDYREEVPVVLKDDFFFLKSIDEIWKFSLKDKTFLKVCKKI